MSSSLGSRPKQRDGIAPSSRPAATVCTSHCCTRAVPLWQSLTRWQPSPAPARQGVDRPRNPGSTQNPRSLESGAEKRRAACSAASRTPRGSVRSAAQASTSVRRDLRRRSSGGYEHRKPSSSASLQLSSSDGVAAGAPTHCRRDEAKPHCQFSSGPARRRRAGSLATSHHGGSAGGWASGSIEVGVLGVESSRRQRRPRARAGINSGIPGIASLEELQEDPLGLSVPEVWF